MGAPKAKDYFYTINNYKTYLLALVFAVFGGLSYFLGTSLEEHKKYSAVISPEDIEGNKEIELVEKKDNVFDLSHLFLHLSTILLAACVVDLVYRIVYHQNFAKKFDSIKEDIINSELAYSSFFEHNILGVYDKLPGTAEIRRLIKSSNHVVIVQTYIPDLHLFRDAVIEAFKTNEKFKIDIFLLNPNSSLATKRSEVIAPNPHTNVDLESVKEDIKGNLKSIDIIEETLKNEQRSQFHLYYYDYDLLPSASIYKFDDVAYIGFYMYGSKAVDTPQLKVNCTKGIGLQFMRHLDYLKNYPNNKVTIKDYYNAVKTNNTSTVLVNTVNATNIQKNVNSNQHNGKRNKHKRKR